MRPILKINYPTVAMITERKQRVMDALRSAVAHYGYDFDEVVGSHSHTRSTADIRAIIWAIYQDATQLSEVQIGLDFDRHRATIFCAIRRARQLRSVDANFADMYNSIEDWYRDALDRKIQEQINS